MVIDRIENAGRYYGLGKGIETVLRFFENYQEGQVEFPGRLVLDGDNIFVLATEYDTKQISPQYLEKHERYIDVMFMVEGSERVYYKPFSDAAKVVSPYDSQRECALAELDDDAAALSLEKGKFVVFMPQDGHLAAQPDKASAHVRKLIAKVAVGTCGIDMPQGV